jgi:adenylosuccinate synthase
MNAILLTDLTFGDAGKGSLVDYLVRRENAHTVVRFNGGAQAAHNVILPDGRHHTFSQFGSGTFVPGVRTHLSHFMLFDPLALAAEERHLRSVGVHDAFARLSLDRNALVVTPFHRAANRLREIARGAARHGSCGMGIGETMADHLERNLTLRAGDLLHPARLRKTLHRFQEAKRLLAATLVLPHSDSSGGLAGRELDLLQDEGASADIADLMEEVARKISIVDSTNDTLHAPGTVIFEGAQGVLLDEWHGFHPHTTWSTTTFANAETLLADARYRGTVRRIGALRAYLTRHGSGPFPTEEARLRALLPDFHNVLNDWQHDFRIGWLDLPLLQYSLDIVGGVSALAVTCLDKLAALPHWRVCVAYKNLPAEFLNGGRIRVCRSQDLGYLQRLGEALAAASPVYDEIPHSQVLPLLSKNLGPIEITSSGSTFRDKMSVSYGVISTAA